MNTSIRNGWFDNASVNGQGGTGDGSFELKWYNICGYRCRN